MTVVTPAQLARLRVERQLLAGDGAAVPADVVRRLLALQAQDFAAARWAIAVRSPGHTREAVDATFDRGAIVRSWTQRGTLHACAAEDLHWLVELTGQRTIDAARTRHAGLGIDAAMHDAAAAVVTELLAKRDRAQGGRATRAEVMAAWRDAGIDPAGQRGMHLIFRLACTGLVCWGPVDDAGQQQLVLVDDWIPAKHRAPVERDVAFDRLVRRYLTGHGPATVHDLAWWSKLRLTELRQAFARLAAAGELVELSADGVDHAMLAADYDEVHASAARRRTVHALPGFDELLLGYQRRDGVLDPAHAEQVVPGGNGVFRAMLVVDGRVVGTWGRAARTRGITVELAPFAPLPRQVVAGLHRSLRAFATYLGTDVEFADDAGRPAT